MGTEQHIPRVFIDQPLSVGQTLDLPTDKTHHLIGVLRLRDDDAVTLFNGTEEEFGARLKVMDKRRVLATIVSAESPCRESSLSITLWLGVCKRDAMAAALRRSTELGVSAIQPVLSDFSAVGSKQVSKLAEKWQQVIEGAAEQSGRTRLPVLHAVSDLQTLLAQAMSDPAETRYVAHPGGGAFSPPGENCQRCLIAIGPEGGFSTNEIQSMTGTGFTAVSLGPRILRAETAPAVALSLLQYMSGDLSG